MVREFLEKATFQTPYFYMILTYGNRHGGARRSWPRSTVCPRGIPVRYINLVHMVDNWLPSLTWRRSDWPSSKPTWLKGGVDCPGYRGRPGRPTRRFWLGCACPAGCLAASPAGDPGLHRAASASRSAPPPPSGWWRTGQSMFPAAVRPAWPAPTPAPRKAVQLTVPEKNPSARYRNPHVTFAGAHPGQPAARLCRAQRRRKEGAYDHGEAMPARRSGW